MPDLHGWIVQQVDHTEDRARRTSEDLFHVLGQIEYEDRGVERDEQHIEHHKPLRVLRRCAADRKILARHRLSPDAYWSDAAMCEGCGTEGEMGYAVTENLNDCPELLDLAEAHGLTPEILAGLDRPQRGERPEPGPGFQMPDAITEGMYGQLWAHVIGTRPVEPRPEVKAMEILRPELRKIPGYVPTVEGAPDA